MQTSPTIPHQPPVTEQGIPTAAEQPRLVPQLIDRFRTFRAELQAAEPADRRRLLVKAAAGLVAVGTSIGLAVKYNIDLPPVGPISLQRNDSGAKGKDRLAAWKAFRDSTGDRLNIRARAALGRPAAENTRADRHNNRRRIAAFATSILLAANLYPAQEQTLPAARPAAATPQAPNSKL